MQTTFQTANGPVTVEGTLEETQELLRSMQLPPRGDVGDLVAHRAARPAQLARGRRAGQSNYPEEFKQEILRGAAAAGEGHIMAYLKSKGVSYSTWQTWEAKARSAAAGGPSKRKDSKRK